MEDPSPPPCMEIPELRDFQRINAELKGLLDRGHPHVRLLGVERQRLLLAGLIGAWKAVVEVEGCAGPELAAGLDAPGLTVVAYGGIADGGARGLKAGSVVVLGDAGTAFGYRLEGGSAIVTGRSGPRAGLEQSGGTIVLGGSTGDLAGERRRGGRLYALDRVGRHANRGQSGGRLLATDDHGDAADIDHFRQLIAELRPWLPPSIAESSWPRPARDRP